MGTQKASPLPEGREISYQIKTKLDASPEAVYDVLADIPTHLEWGSTQVKKNFRLTSLDGGDASARQGTEWSSTGSAPDGTFRDRSIVTEASRPRTFEFKTESRVSFKNGTEADWTSINRYDIEPAGGGSKVTLTQRMTRATDLGGARLLLNPIMGRLGRMMMGGMIKPAIKNLGTMAAARRPG